ncbi:hypothetical protein NF552_08075 [Roseomonas mucosa]|nr:hypothetical protein NF552_08075 [Roseomonas mucosa]
MLGEVLVHLEHGDLVLAEDLAQLVVGQDLALVLRVLQVMGLDVFPDLADDLAARQLAFADNGGQFGEGWSGCCSAFGLSLLAAGFFSVVLVLIKSLRIRSVRDTRRLVAQAVQGGEGCARHPGQGR